jgi:hypothetical protein
MKQCIKCKQDKPLSAYQSNPSNKDKYDTRCRDCVSAYNKAYTIKHKADLKLKWQAYNASPKGRANHKRTKLKHLIKVRARTQVTEALRIGKLIKPDRCTNCSNIKVEAHHNDYSKPLQVIWLCRNCHTSLHKQINAQFYIK